MDKRWLFKINDDWFIKILFIKKFKKFVKKESHV